MQQHGRTSKTSGQTVKSRYKDYIHTAWFHLYKTKNKKNLQNRIMMGRTILNHSCLYEGGKGHEGLSAVMIDSMS